MPRIILSLALIVVVMGAITFGATNAFFSDTETSVANVFTAGAIDLKVDNESYYNGVFNALTSWSQADLNDGNGPSTDGTYKFFDFDDLKPADYGEDTISLHVDTNDAFMCANVTLTSDDDNTQTEPEAEVDSNGLATGELADLVNFIWWADDGDNVLENDESIISQGPIGALPLNAPYELALADADENVWGGVGPVDGDETYYLGKAWCFGTIGTDPIDQDDSSTLMSPAGNNGGTALSGEPEDGGITCDGSSLGNESQTDSLTADIEFTVVQSRNNPGFQCEENCVISEEVTLIPDSGFENPIVTASSLWDIFPSPAGAWKVMWRDSLTNTFGGQTRPEPANLEIHKGVVGTPDEGLQYAELDTDWGGPFGAGDGEPASVTIYQDIPTVIGKEYRIQFSFGARPNTAASENRLETKWGGVVVDDTGFVLGAGGDIDWDVRTIDVVATTTMTRLAFTDLGTSNSIGTFVDDFRLYTESCNLPE